MLTKMSETEFNASQQDYEDAVKGSRSPRHPLKALEMRIDQAYANRFEDFPMIGKDGMVHRALRSMIQRIISKDG